MRSRSCIFVITALVALGAPPFAAPANSPSSASADSNSGALAAEELRLQDVVDQLKARLAVNDEVAVAIVAENPLMVSVEARQGPNGVFRMAFERNFLEDLTPSELEAVIAHELGHIWIF